MLELKSVLVLATHLKFESTQFLHSNKHFNLKFRRIFEDGISIRQPLSRREDRSSMSGSNVDDIHSYVNKHMCKHDRQSRGREKTIEIVYGIVQHL